MTGGSGDPGGEVSLLDLYAHVSGQEASRFLRPDIGGLTLGDWSALLRLSLADSASYSNAYTPYWLHPVCLDYLGLGTPTNSDVEWLRTFYHNRDDVEESDRRLQDWQAWVPRLAPSPVLIVAREPSITDGWMPSDMNGAYVLRTREAVRSEQSAKARKGLAQKKSRMEQRTHRDEALLTIEEDPFIDLLIAQSTIGQTFTTMFFEAAPADDPDEAGAVDPSRVDWGAYPELSDLNAYVLLARTATEIDTAYPVLRAPASLDDASMQSHATGPPVA